MFRVVSQGEGHATAATEEAMIACPLRICLVAPLPPPYGGISNWTALVRRHAQLRPEVKLQIVDTAVRWRAVDELAVWKRVVGGGLQWLRDYVRCLRVLRTRPAIIHLTTSGSFGIVRDLAILATARRKGVPAIYHLRFGRVPEIAAENTREWRLLARAIRLANVVIAIDAATKAAIIQYIPQIKTLLIPNGIDLKELPLIGGQAGLRTVLFLGWVIPTKGLSELVQAWSQLKLPGWRCVVAGPGSETYRKELQQRFQPTQLEFLPEQSHDDAMRLMASADVFVLPSHTEGFPNVIIEAMAMGKAIVATSVGAIPEMLADWCGLVVPPHDANALGQALHQVCADAALRKEMGTRARLKSRAEYDMDRVFDRLVATWQEIAK